MSDNTFLMEIDASLGGFDEKHAQDLYRPGTEKLSIIPGVRNASISATVPFGDSAVRRSVQRAGVHPAPDARPVTATEGMSFSPYWNSVGADYFKAVGLPLLRGRAFTSAEATQQAVPPVAVVDEVLAKNLWPDGDALGQQIQFPIRTDAPPEKFDGTGKSGAENRSRSLELCRLRRTGLFDQRQWGRSTFRSVVDFKRRLLLCAMRLDHRWPMRLVRQIAPRTVHEVDPLLPILELRTFVKHVEANPQLWIVRVVLRCFQFSVCWHLAWPPLVFTE